MKTSRWLLLLGLAACARPSAAHGPDASTVCNHLAGLGCPEGLDPDCPAAIAESVTENHVTVAGLSCVEGAPSRADAVKCAPSYLVCGGAAK